MTIFAPAAYAAVGDTSVAGYTTFADAVATLNAAATDCVLVVPAGTHAIATDLTVNANIHLHILKGGILSVATTKVLTLNCSLEAGNYKIFTLADATGNLLIGRAIPAINAAWFGCDPASFEGAYPDQTANFNKAFAVMRAASGILVQRKRLYIPSGNYYVTGAIWAGNMGNVDIVGDGSNCTKITGAVTTSDSIFDTTGLANSTLRGLWIHGNDNANTAKVGLLLARSNTNVNAANNITDIRVSGFFTVAGIYNISIESSSLTEYRVELYKDANHNPLYGVFIGGANKDSITSNYDTILDNYSLATFYLGNGSIIVPVDTGAVTENLYLYRVWNVNIYNVYLLGGVAAAAGGTIHLDDANATSLRCLLLETAHYAALYLSGNISQFVSDESVEYNGATYAIYQASPGTYGLSGSTIKGIIKGGDISIGGSHNNTYKFVTHPDNSSFSATLQTTSGDLIQIESGCTLSVTAGGVESSTIIGNPGTLSMAGSAKAGVADGTTAGKCKTTNAITYRAQDGTVYTKAGTDDFWDLTAVSTGAAEYMKVALCINSAGTASIVQGTKAASQAAAKLPDIPLNILCLGYVQIPNNYGGGDLSGFVFYDK